MTQNSVATDCREYGIYGISLESDKKKHTRKMKTTAITITAKTTNCYGERDVIS